MNVTPQGERIRLGEDDLVSRALIKLLADCIGVSTSEFRLPLLTEAGSASGNVDVYQESKELLLDPIDDLVAGRVSRQMMMCMHSSSMYSSSIHYKLEARGTIASSYACR